MSSNPFSPIPLIDPAALDVPNCPTMAPAPTLAQPRPSQSPVVVQPTRSESIPAYLRAVVLLRPDGNVAAEVVAAVARFHDAAAISADGFAAIVWSSVLPSAASVATRSLTVTSIVL